MTNHHTDSTVVGGIVGIELEERRLQDCCGEANLVGGGVVVGIHGLRSHAPLVLVDGLVDFAEHVVHVELVATHHVGIITVVFDFEAAVVAPLVGVTNLDVDGAQFGMGVNFGAVGHPFGHVDALTEGGDEVLHQGLHAGLCFGGEIFLDIELAKGLAHSSVDNVGDAFPTGPVGFLAAHQLAVEVELGVDKVIAQVGGGSIDFVPSEVSLDGVDVSICQSLVDLGETFGSCDVEALHSVEYVHRGEIAFPIDVGSEVGSLIEGVAVEGCKWVAALNLCEVRLGETGLEVHNHLGELVGLNAAHLVVARHGEELGHHFDIADTELGVVALVEQIVVAVAETQTCLVSPGNTLCGIVLVGLAKDTEKDMVAAVVHLDNFVPDVLAGLESVDFLEVGLKGLYTLLLQLNAVHTDVVERCNLVGDRAFLVLVCRHRVDNALQLFLILLTEEDESTVTRVLGIERVGGHPAAAGELVEVVFQTRCGVEIVKVDARRELGLVLTTGSDNCHSSNA